MDLILKKFLHNRNGDQRSYRGDVSANIQRQVLYWYDQQGKRYQTSEEAEQQTRQ